MLLEYPAPPPGAAAPATSLVISGGQAPAPRGGSTGQLQIGFIGAGNYASSMLLPHLARLGTAPACARRDHPVAVGDERSAAVRLHHRLDHSRRRCSTDDSLDAIFIVTRHHTHADLVCRALETGKAVFVEKPLALTGEELDQDRRGRRRPPATTGSWSASTAASLRC